MVDGANSCLRQNARLENGGQQTVTVLTGFKRRSHPWLIPSEKARSGARFDLGATNRKGYLEAVRVSAGAACGSP